MIYIYLILLLFDFISWEDKPAYSDFRDLFSITHPDSQPLQREEGAFQAWIYRGHVYLFIYSFTCTAYLCYDNLLNYLKMNISTNPQINDN